MRHQMECSPFLTRPLRSLQEVERSQGIVRDLDDDDHFAISHGAQEYLAVMSMTEGAPADRRLHLRQFFRYLRDRIKEVGDVCKAVELVDYDDAKVEQEHWEKLAEVERRHLLTERMMFQWRKL